MIANTGNAADYKWLAEPGEDYDNQIQPSFATIKGMALDDANPLSTLDALTLLFSDNWFDSNFGNNERFLLVTSALELVFINELIEKGAGTESAFKLLQGWRHLRRQRDRLPRHAQGIVEARQDPPGVPAQGVRRHQPRRRPGREHATASARLDQVIALAAYKNAIQTYEHFSERREQDGGTRFKGTEYVQDFSYDCWVIDQLSEGVVPLFLPDTVDNLAGRGRLLHLRRRRSRRLVPS